MDGPDHVRPRAPRLRESQRRARPHQLRPVHVVVDDLGTDVGHERGHGPDGDRVVRLLEDVDGQAQAGDLAGRAAAGERDDRRVVAAPVEAREERVDVLLGAAVGAGRQDLHDTHGPAARERGPVHRLTQGSPGAGPI